MAICKIGGLLLRHFPLSPLELLQLLQLEAILYALRSEIWQGYGEITSNFNKTLKQSNKNFPF